MGLGSLNLARDLSLPIAERLGFETEGVAHVQRAFKLNNRSVAASLALASVMALGRHLPEASKLAERAIQYADNKRHSVLANSERGRLGFMAGDVTDAGRFIAAAKAEDPAVNMMAELTLAQIAIKTGNLREALAFVEQTAKRIAGKGPVEFTVLHASLLAYPHLGMPADELARNRQNARTMLAGIQDAVSSAKTEKEVAELRGVRYDTDAFIELAKLWQDESVDKAITSYQTAISIKSDPDSNSDNLLDTQTESQERKPVDYANVRLSTNLAALYALQGETENAERMFQEALQTLASEDGKEADSLKTVLAFDLGRTSEQNGDAVKASQWYRDVLGQHPEHMDSKVRLASITAAAGRNADAHNYLKECLRADEHNLSLRAAYTNFLISLGSYKEALAFTSQTLKQDKHDAWTFTALGWLHFTLGREAKSPQDVAERSKQYLRSAEAYERALGLDPNNAVAAQGLAIALAEDTLLSKAQQAAQSSADDVKNRNRLAGQALAVFGRIKDSLPEGAVNVNIGHCYFIRGEEERAIEAYGAALNAFGGRKVAVLLYLCRAWYAYANKESNFSAMGQALNYAQKAMHIQPSDRAILYNIAMIQQKAAEIMLSLDPSRRMLDELHVALKHAQEAVSVFRSLADDKSGPLPYDADLADQRARYGEGLLRKAPEQIAKQEAYESETAARVEEARRLRAEEQARIEAAAAARKAEIDARAAELAEERRKAREEARQFQETLEAQQQEEEQRRLEKLEQRKRRKEDDEVVDGEEKPRRKRKGKKRKPKSDVSDDDEPSAEPSAPMSEDDGPEAQERKAKRTLAMLKARVSGFTFFCLTNRGRNPGERIPIHLARILAAEASTSPRPSLRIRTRKWVTTLVVGRLPLPRLPTPLRGLLLCRLRAVQLRHLPRTARRHHLVFPTDKVVARVLHRFRHRLLLLLLKDCRMGTTRPQTTCSRHQCACTFSSDVQQVACISVYVLGLA